MLIVLLFTLLIASWYVWKSRMDDYMEKDPVVTALKIKLMPVFPELAAVKLMKGSSSYTINKHRVYICTEQDGRVYDSNMLTYVILHELAHVLSPDIGHGNKFQAIFAKLLERGARARVYDPTKPRIENYCKK